MGKKVEIQLDERLMDVVGGLEGEALDGSGWEKSRKNAFGSVKKKKKVTGVLFGQKNEQKRETTSLIFSYAE